MDCAVKTRSGTGVERRVVELTKRFQELGVQPHTMEYSQFYRDHKRIDGTITRVNMLHIGQILRGLYLALVGLRICLKKRIDAVYVSRSSLESLLSALLISKILRKPLIIVFHVGLYHKFSPKKLVSGMRSRGLTSLLLLLTSYVIKSLAWKSADACVAVSRHTAAQVRVAMKNKPVYVAGNGVDLDVFTPNVGVTKSYEACYLGRLDKAKGMEVLLKSWRIVVDGLPQSKLLIIGGGKNEIAHYQALAKRFSLDRNVVFVGWVNDDREVVRFLRSSKLFVFPSKFEGFGLAVAEAMACGLCCIISDIPVHRENFSVVDFADPDDPKAFSGRILHYLLNEDEYVKMGLSAYQFAQRFNWKSVAQTEAQIIKSAVGRRRSYCAPFQKVSDGALR